MAVVSQGIFWTLLFAVNSLACGVCVWQLWNDRLTRPAMWEQNAPTKQNDPPPSPGRMALWLLLPAIASVMLLAITNHVCQNLPPTPFLWVVPLSLYLLTFIISFDNPRWYVRSAFAAGALISCFALGLRAAPILAQQYLLEVLISFIAMFCVCMLCHGELVRLKPSPQRLTIFYLMCSAGGAVGGLLVAVVCPWLLDGYFELNVVNAIGFTLAALILANASGITWKRTDPAENEAASHASPRPMRLIGGCLLVFSVVIIVNLECIQPAQSASDAAKRNFYGVVSIRSDATDRPDERLIAMVHGHIIHGVQFDSQDRKREPTTYYHQTSGIGHTLRWFNEHRTEPQHIGAVGMGAGTIAVYGRPVDRYRFYEINPAVIEFAQEHFTFLSDCEADVSVIPGDARLSLENEPPQQFDLLVLDAFSGDAVPAHLLTRQAMQIYLRHLRDDGAIAVHVSNDYLDLRPVIVGLAEEFELECLFIDTPGDRDSWKFTSQWMILTTNDAMLTSPEIDDVAKRIDRSEVTPVLWTDEFNNLLQVLK